MSKRDVLGCVERDVRVAAREGDVLADAGIGLKIGRLCACRTVPVGRQTTTPADPLADQPVRPLGEVRIGKTDVTISADGVIGVPAATAAVQVIIRYGRCPCAPSRIVVDEVQDACPLTPPYLLGL